MTQGAPETAFVEQITHPALASALVARGVLRVEPGGVLVREQTFPDPQTARIGRDFLELTQGEASNLLPIPADMAPMLAALRALVWGDAAGLATDFALDLAPHPGGWQLRLDPRAPGRVTGMRARGCGARLRAIDLALDDGTQRHILLGSAP